MEDNSKLVFSKWEVKSDALADRLRYLVGSLASISKECDKQVKKGVARPILSFGELAMLHAYSLELVTMTDEFIKPDNETDQQTLDRVATHSECFGNKS